MENFFPCGLSNEVFDILARCQNESINIPIETLLDEAHDYLKKTKEAHYANPIIVNYPLAEALHEAIIKTVNNWDRIPTHAQSWCKAMILYFNRTFDGDHDFKSPLGFDDDAEVINACLRFAGLEELCVDPEGVDNV